MRRANVLVGSSLVLFAGTTAVLLYDPDAELFVALAIALCIAIAPFVRIDLTPWLVAPPLAALTLWAFSAPGGYVLAAAAAVLCAALYSIVLLVRLTALSRRRPLTTATRRTWLGSAVAGVVVAVVAATSLPLELRFRLSEDAMTRAARDVISGERDPATIDRIGLWNVRDAERVPGGMRFLVEGAGLFDSHGFLYSTDGLPPPDATYYGSGWYTWSSDFELQG